MEQILSPADILLPKQPLCERFAVVACDQYTSEPEYWEAVEELVGDSPSALRMIVPEQKLLTGDVSGLIAGIEDKMQEYLSSDVFQSYENSYLFIERTLPPGGAVRSGLIGKLDLKQYDYQKGAVSPVRATEATVLERIPPRVAVRENAALESPHVMLLIDDRSDSVMSAARQAKAEQSKLYDFPLMMQSGSLAGWRVENALAKKIEEEIKRLCNRALCMEKYGVDAPPLVFAVGDGNHSLATAKECYSRLCEKNGEAAMENHPARYALVEVVNLHEPSLQFEPVHRIVCNIDRRHLLFELNERLGGPGKQRFSLVQNGYVMPFTIGKPTSNMAVGSLQTFLDDYVKTFGGQCDYIHGDDVVGRLSKDENTLGFLLPPIEKNNLFKTVLLDGSLTRKTFSMGRACDKRFYLECRKIR